jgi:hypothetical protein
VDAELIAAIGAAAVSGVAAVIAIWQARIAKGAARSAQTQAQAAEEQVALMRRQIEGEEEARREARGPNFSPSYDRTRTHADLRQPVATIKLKQNDGPGLTTARVSVSGDGIIGLYVPPEVLSAGGPGEELGPMAPGASKEVRVVLEPAARTRGITVTFSLRCEDGSGAMWIRSYSCDIPRPARASGI